MEFMWQKSHYDLLGSTVLSSSQVAWGCEEGLRLSPQSPASHCVLRLSLFQTGRPLIQWTRLIGWRGSICFIEGCRVTAVTLSPNQLFIGSYLVFNLAAVYGIRLMAVKWLRHKHGPSAEKALVHCLFERLS